MNFESLILDRRDGVATITLNRPDALNALNLALGRELFHAALDVDDDPRVRCVVITGAGKAFCAGGDVKDFADNLERIGVLVKELPTYLHGTVSRFARSDKPVIMAVNGVAAGGGFSFALSGDLVLAAESARFTMAYSKIAATPDGSSSYFLPRLVGLRRAMELYFTNRVLSAREALEWGLITRVVPDAEFKGAVDTLARELAQGPSKAFGAAKRLFHHSTWESLETQMELEAQAIANSSRTEISRPASPRSRTRRHRRPSGGDNGGHESAPVHPPRLILLRQDEGAALVLGGRVRPDRRPGRPRRPQGDGTPRYPAAARRRSRRPRRARLESGRLRGAAGRELSGGQKILAGGAGLAAGSRARGRAEADRALRHHADGARAARAQAHAARPDVSRVPRGALVRRRRGPRRAAGGMVRGARAEGARHGRRRRALRSAGARAAHRLVPGRRRRRVHADRADVLRAPGRRRPARAHDVARRPAPAPAVRARGASRRDATGAAADGGAGGAAPARSALVAGRHSTPPARAEVAGSAHHNPRALAYTGGSVCAVA